MQHHDDPRPIGLPTNEAIEIVHTVTSPIEAAVVRGLLVSAGIASPALGDPYLSDLAPLYCEIRVYALQSQASEARQVIAEYLAEGRRAADEDELEGA